MGESEIYHESSIISKIYRCIFHHSDQGQNGKGWASEVLTLHRLKKRRMGGVLAISKGGGEGTTSSEVVLTRELEVLVLLKWGAKSFHPLKGGGWGDFPIL